MLWQLWFSFCSWSMPQDLCTAGTDLVLPPAFCLVDSSVPVTSRSLPPRGGGVLGKAPLLDILWNWSFSV